MLWMMYKLDLETASLLLKRLNGLFVSLSGEKR